MKEDLNEVGAETAISERIVPKLLDPKAVELANAYGPYTHGTWAGSDIVIGNEEALAGRGAFLCELIRRSILEKFTAEQLRCMTLVDVGCYDGWLICQLEDLPFDRLIGVEPRKKNLDKGRMIRQLLGIKSRCEFRQGSIENLKEVFGTDTADVVICTGVFHHLSSTSVGVAALRDICRNFLFLETICFPADLEDQRLQEALELKDLPYFSGNAAFGVTGHKLESGYYDGSATQMSVVSLPSVEALKMFLDVGGFADIKIVADPEVCSKAFAGGDRRFSAVCITASPRTSPIDVTPWIEDYEGGLVRTLLPIAIVYGLFKVFCLNEEATNSSPIEKLVIDLTLKSGTELDQARKTLRNEIDNVYAQEIFKNMRYAPHDKIALEYGKCLAAEGKFDESEQMLYLITQRLNADWRAVYRAFCVIAWSCRERGDIAAANRYEELCRIANPLFPPALLAGTIALFQPLNIQTIKA